MSRFLRRIQASRVASRDVGRRGCGSRASGALALLFALCAIANGARGDERWVEDEPRWIPSLRVGFETFGYDTESTVDNLINPPKNAGTQNNSNTLYMLQFGVELMGPILSEGLPGHPRLFAQAGTQFKPVSSDAIFEIDVPGDPTSEILNFQNRLANALARPTPCDQTVPSTCPLQPDSFLGEGSEIEAELQDLSWSAALGVAFTFPVANSVLLQIKPSLAYNLDRIDMSGRLTTVVDTGSTVTRIVRRGNQTFVVQVPDLVIYQSAASERVNQHSLGPGLELGVVLFPSIRPVRATLYADARFLWLLGNRTTSFGDSVATYTVRRDPFEIRGGAGVRFSWVGFRGR